MIQPYLDAITRSLFHQNPLFEKGVSLAFLDDKGRVMMQSNPEQNEYQWAGISDTSSNYFYIRHRDSGEIIHEQIESRNFGSCSGPVTQLSKFEFRVVASMVNFCPYKLERLVREGLMKSNFQDTATITVVTVTPVRSNVNSMAVVAEESPVQKQFDKNLIFVAVDFDLSMKIKYF